MVLERGRTYTGKVAEVLSFGWVIQLEPSGDRGLLHCTEYSHGPERIETSDYLPMGEELQVKVLDVDGGGKIKLSRKALLPVPEGTLPRPRTPLGGGMRRGSSAGTGTSPPGTATFGGFKRNEDGTLKRPLEREKPEK